MVVSAQPVVPSCGYGACDRLFVCLKQVDLIRPGRCSDKAFVREIGDLGRSITPIFGSDLALALKKGDRSIELRLGQFIGIGDAKLGVMGLQIIGGICNVDRADISLNTTVV